MFVVELEPYDVCIAEDQCSLMYVVTSKDRKKKAHTTFGWVKFRDGNLEKSGTWTVTPDNRLNSLYIVMRGNDFIK